MSTTVSTIEMTMLARQPEDLNRTGIWGVLLVCVHSKAVAVPNGGSGRGSEAPVPGHSLPFG